MKSSADDSTLEATVFYDGGCPLCRAEILTYQNAQGGERVRWVDASVCRESDFGEGLSRQHALARLHVRQANGHLVSGARAFLVIWSALPHWRWLALVAKIPGILPIMEWSYGAFLKLRRLWRNPRTVSTPATAEPLRAGQRAACTDHVGKPDAVVMYQGVHPATPSNALQRDGELFK